MTHQWRYDFLVSRTEGVFLFRLAFDLKQNVKLVPSVSRNPRFFRLEAPAS